ncbi:hypothetical protein B0A55_06105 [Friedmanniomyces simplex]|uniref:C2H2-type domain-containing protein n=1 Tax=Friedmanniomyces simplex TaxID=329884 RepID=A0A4U0XJR3_9PEZI|nr:hypothetical protein B0A55_06105 [Friedmanniomyces simplex]
MSDFTNYDDPVDDRDITNEADWLEAAIALDPDYPAIAAAEQRLFGCMHAAHVATRVDDSLSAGVASGPASHHGTPAGPEDHRDTTRNQLNLAVSNNVGSPNSVAGGGQAFIIVCHRISDIPPGRKAAKILQCGICMSDKLFDRRFELERHMALHWPEQHPCVQPGCAFTGARAFKRADELRKHEREAHRLGKAWGEGKSL